MWIFIFPKQTRSLKDYCFPRGWGLLCKATSTSCHGDVDALPVVPVLVVMFWRDDIYGKKLVRPWCACLFSLHETRTEAKLKSAWKGIYMQCNAWELQFLWTTALFDWTFWQLLHSVAKALPRWPPSFRWSVNTRTPRCPSEWGKTGHKNGVVLCACLRVACGKPTGGKT